VPQDHLLRKIDRFLDLSNLHEHLTSYYSHTGRPSIDPELMIRMLIIGYCLGIRSERRLCEEVKLNLEKKPGHPSISTFYIHVCLHFLLYVCGSAPFVQQGGIDR